MFFYDETNKDLDYFFPIFDSKKGIQILNSEKSADLHVRQKNTKDFNVAGILGKRCVDINSDFQLNIGCGYLSVGL